MRRQLLALALASALILAGTTVASAAPTHDGTSLTSFARSYVGYRYAYAGDTPSTGFSCTGFVHWVYSHFGYNTPEDPYALSNTYPHVSAANMVPGDVLLFANTFHPGLSHAAIYLGGGLMVGADNFAVGVHVDSVWDSYWGPRFVTALRVAPYGPPSQSVQGFAYTRKPAPAPQRKPAPAPSKPLVRAASLHVRTGPGYGYAAVGVLHRGAPVRILARKGSWVRIRSGSGLLGWVLAAYVH